MPKFLDKVLEVGLDFTDYREKYSLEWNWNE